MNASINPLQADFDTATHEAGHAVAAVLLGGKLLRVVGHRHHALTSDERGSVEWLPNAMSPEAEAIVCLAGIAAVRGFGVCFDTDTPDERAMKRLGLPEWQRQRRVDAYLLSCRRDFREAVDRLSAALDERGVLSGPEAERIARGG